jgi:FKBP-type peptidyl-prolyl cis-trans isomerase (trigger factor)
MKLEHFGMAEPGDCRLVFRAGAEELAAAIAAEQAAENAPQEEEDLLTAAVNRTILAGFSPLYEQLVREYGLVPVSDPDFQLLAVNRAEGFRAGAQFFALPPLELGAYTGFVQAVEPHPIRQLTVELEINRNHGDEDRAADAAGKAALRKQVTADIYAKRCAQARDRAAKELVWQLGDRVTGPLPKQLVAGNYFAEQRQFNLRLQANGVNFDQFLKVRGQTVEEFRVWLHQQAERKLRSWLGLLLVAEKEDLQPAEAEVTAALENWNEKLDGERTFPANDARKVRQRLARERAEQFIVAHSTLTPPPSEPVVQQLS